ncbi:hypothetical protein [Streptomyces sp. ST2-7A]|uniref:hypothetical protein n=1 Tax=Streptomyces sp. ST2-7A TaxID=2907214 RepID=UPI001F477FE5|nr:hypothetical protein [Streptomyces sp. ST2-7A]MCE7082263.1 hypothetical protein [Streptomyces sp. ST2-7A]
MGDEGARGTNGPAERGPWPDHAPPGRVPPTPPPGPPPREAVTVPLPTAPPPGEPGGSRRRALSAAALNLSGLGVGYLYLRQWRRFAVGLGGVLVLVAFAVGTEAPGGAVVWAPLFLLCAAVMVADAWRLGGTGPDPRPVRAPPVAAGVLLVIVALGYFWYSGLPEREMGRADRAHVAGDCESAVPHYERAVSPRHALAFHSLREVSALGVNSCEVMLRAEASAARGANGEAADGYRSYVDLHDGRPPWAGAGDRLVELRAAHADDLTAGVREAAESVGGADDFDAQSVVEAFDARVALRGEHPGTAEAVAVPEGLDELYDATTPALGSEDHCAAVAQLRAVVLLPGLTELPDEWVEGDADRLADRAREPLPATLRDCAIDRYGDGDLPDALGRLSELVSDFPDSGPAGNAPDTLEGFRSDLADSLDGEAACGLFDDLEALVALPRALSGDGFTRVSDRATGSLGEAWFECGLAAHGSDDPDTAREHLERLLDEQPDHSRAGRAEEILIAIEIDRIAGGDTNELPPPAVSGSGPAGSVIVTIINDSDERLEVLYTGPRTGRTSVPAASSGGQCLAQQGKPTVTLTLTPGKYQVVARTSGDGGFVSPYHGEWDLRAGTAYGDCYYIGFLSP